jgi:hypothetical protein
MKRTICLLLLIASILLLPACSCGKKNQKQTSNAVPAKDYPALGYVKATLVKFDVDGCKWLLQSEDGKKLVPQQMPEGFSTDGMKVWLKFETLKDAVGICMAGDMVKVIALEKRD